MVVRAERGVTAVYQYLNTAATARRGVWQVIPRSRWRPAFDLRYIYSVRI